MGSQEWNDRPLLFHLSKPGWLGTPCLLPNCRGPRSYPLGASPRDPFSRPSLGGALGLRHSPLALWQSCWVSVCVEQEGESRSSPLGGLDSGTLGQISSHEPNTPLSPAVIGRP